MDLGKELYFAAVDAAKSTISDKATIESLGLDDADRDYIFKEFLIVNFYCIIWSIDSLIEDEADRNLVFDNMHFEHYKILKENFGFTAELIKREHDYIISRYSEYNNARKEKLGPNELWPLTKQMLTNLRPQKAEDIVEMLTLTNSFTNFMKTITEFVKEFKIKRN